MKKLTKNKKLSLNQNVIENLSTVSGGYQAEYPSFLCPSNRFSKCDNCTFSCGTSCWCTGIAC